MATVEAREADPNLASPSAHSTSNRFPFVTTDAISIPPPLEAEDVLETKCVRASASDQGLVYRVLYLETLHHDMQFYTILVC